MRKYNKEIRYALMYGESLQSLYRKYGRRRVRIMYKKRMESIRSICGYSLKGKQDYLLAC